MKLCLAAILFFPLLSYGIDPPARTEPGGKLSYYLNAFSETDGSTAAANDLLGFVEKLEAKRTSVKNQKAFLRYLFDETHHRFLKSFTQYVPFAETLNKGTYNCLTGVALYALLLDHFKIDYQIIETNYHIFLLAQVGKDQILLEATDPKNGFVADPDKIKQRIQNYRQNSIQQSSQSKYYYQYSVDLYKTVSLDEMLGLLHYNLSVVAYNEQNLVVAIDHLTQAAQLYQSPRIEELSQIILLTIMESKIAPSVRQQCLENIQTLRRNLFNLTARN